MADQRIADLAQALNIPLVRASALLAVFMEAARELLDQKAAEEVESVRRIVAAQAAVQLGQQEALLLEVRQLHDAAGATVVRKPAAAGAKPRVNTWFANKCIDPEFRAILAAKFADPRFKNPDGQPAVWKQHGKVVWNELSKSADEADKELCQRVRKMLDDEFDGNRDGRLEVPDDAASVASEAAEDPAPEPVKPKKKAAAADAKPAKKAAAAAAAAAADSDADAAEPAAPAKAKKAEPAKKKPAKRKAAAADDDDDD
jgi:hypothetical protein